MSPWLHTSTALKLCMVNSDGVPPDVSNTSMFTNRPVQDSASEMVFPVSPPAHRMAASCAFAAPPNANHTSHCAMQTLP